MTAITIAALIVGVVFWFGGVSFLLQVKDERRETLGTYFSWKVRDGNGTSYQQKKESSFQQVCGFLLQFCTLYYY